MPEPHPAAEVRCSGRLVCATEDEADTVRRHLPDHVRLTRAEAGCIAFDVLETDDALVRSVAERFTDQDAFERHQHRVAGSEWGRATAGIERRYVIEAVAG
ncbi:MULTISPECIES: putative quinol monooxygenase [unclassified Curtobacterium]|uniref:putative quinol monooxygenase n=1 Tax=unclassified Curtobacterium TaxID=257496 RepID=UPI00226B892E|nr:MULTISPECIES: antibiotic biosynthesis monooxygenase [unclassified Curtobacterium]